MSIFISIHPSCGFSYFYPLYYRSNYIVSELYYPRIINRIYISNIVHEYTHCVDNIEDAGGIHRVLSPADTADFIHRPFFFS